MSAFKIIRSQLKIIETEAGLLALLRIYAKTDGGRLTDFGRDLISSAKRSGIKQADIAKLLDLSPGAVSQHYNK
ncbi:hypothetical protein ABAC460_02415 [Asticcacaulis sp. AC460]|uniref:hypothetical protein n=1 Tax=Asticcacaulis sp. AC460 TaxID=1282360 RepID=UPI0003C3D257|nr:hypothetical protein [Asticcacaulis sp. AC460]ESQ92702.1 hypothetical protein ABAC460_02415 [Asticcacaulis sp. AC460]